MLPLDVLRLLVTFCDPGTGECEIDPTTALVCPEVTAPCGVAVCESPADLGIRMAEALGIDVPQEVAS